MQKMKNVVSISYLVVMLLPLTAMAGNGVSGGGNARVCFESEAVVREIIEQTAKGHADLESQYQDFLDGSSKEARLSPVRIPDDFIDSIISIDTLDYLLMKSRIDLDGEPVDLLSFAQETSVTDALNALEERYSSSERISYILTRGQKLMRYSTYANPLAVKQMPDVNISPSFIGPNCLVTTIALQTSVPIERRYGEVTPFMKLTDLVELQIDTRLFSHPTHSPMSQRVLMIHEVVYAVALNDFLLGNRGYDVSNSVHKIINLMLKQDKPTAREIDILMEGYGFSQYAFDYIKSRKDK